MPQWLCNQLLRAYQRKDSRQIRYLNDCWFFYQNPNGKRRHGSPGTSGFIGGDAKKDK